MLAGWNLKNTTKISNKVRYACLEGKQYAKRKTRAKIHKGWLELQKCTHTICMGAQQIRKTFAKNYVVPDWNVNMSKTYAKNTLRLAVVSRTCKNICKITRYLAGV